jgi:MarR family transcriptional regulator, organic hydroperoxide resistance regulator
MGWCPDSDKLGQEMKLDQQIFDAVAEFIGCMMRRGEKLADQFGVPVFCFKALHRLDTPVSMKELGKRMRCDPSFVTMIADALEKRGLAQREPNPADRRIKNLVLTPAGLEFKAQMEQAMLGELPWSSALDMQEKETLLALIRKMLSTMNGTHAMPAMGERAGEPSTAPQPVSLT